MALFEAGGSAASPPRVHGFRIQQSRTPIVIPVVYGTARIPANVIWFGDWMPFRVNLGGKGGPSITGYRYLMSFQLALCQGPIKSVNSGWETGGYASRIPPNIVQQDWAVFLGEFGQQPWPYLLSHHPGMAIGYTGVAWVGQEWPTTPSNVWSVEAYAQDALPQFSFEVTGLLPYTDPTGVTHLDANPADVIADLMTNPLYGLKISSEYIGDLSDYRDYCAAYGLLLSPVFDRQRQAGQWITLLLEITNADVVFSAGQMRIVPYGDAPATANGVTWTPNLEPVYSLTDDDFIAERHAAPVQVQRKIPQDRFNVWVIEYSDRANDYRQGMVAVYSDADIQTYMLRKAQPREYLPVTDAGTAQRVAQLQMQRALTVLNTYLFRVDQRFILLEPMDIVAITDATLGLDAYPVRIVEIVEERDGTLSITAEDLGANSTPGYPVQAHAPSNRYSAQLSPVGINPPMLYEPPPLYTQGVLELLIGVSGAQGNANWGGCYVYYSLDGDTYNLYAHLTQPAIQGFLTAPLPAASDPDTTDTLSVALYDAAQTLSSVSQSLADQGENLILVDQELISFATATVVGPGQYDLSYLRRGVGGSTVAAHGTGAQFTYLGSLAKLDPAILRIVYSNSMVGKTVYFKFASVNGEGGAQQSLADVTAYAVTLVGVAHSVPPVQGGPAWQPQASYAQGAVIQADGFFFVAKVGGVTGSTEPTWPLGVGQSVVDGSVVWVNSGPAPTFAQGTITLQGTETNSSTQAIGNTMTTVVSTAVAVQSASDVVLLNALVEFTSDVNAAAMQIVDQAGVVHATWYPVPAATGGATNWVPLTAFLTGLSGPYTFSLQIRLPNSSGAQCFSATLSAIDLRQ